MSSPRPFFRPAARGDLDSLSALALRSKAWWGYPPELMTAFREELTLTDDLLAEATVEVMELDARSAGFFALEPLEDEPHTVELGLFFVEPDCIGRGLGRLMMQRAMDHARRLGFRRIMVQSDPHAETFYRRMGFERMGTRPSASIPGRMLPILAAECLSLA